MITRDAARRPAAAAFVTMAVLVLVALFPPPARAADTARDAESELIALANIERAKVGLGAVTERSDIRTVARRWSASMADRNQLAHNPDYSKQITGWQRISENVGYGPSIEAIHRALMNSEGHRRNILDDRVTEVGIGVVISSGRVWITQNFRRPLSGLVFAAPSTTTFGDVSSTSVHAPAIRTIATSGVEVGCSTARYCPHGPVTRAQFASMLVRALDIPPTTERRFTDISGPHAADIEALATAGITAGCEPDRFCPDVRLSRAHMASFLARSLELEPGVSPFVDTPDTHAGAIGALYGRGIVKGCATTRFCSYDTVNRAQTASMLARTLG